MVRVKIMRAKEFEKKLRMRNVVCFCAGRGLSELCEVYPLMAERICYVIDNYGYGKKIALGSKEVSVISMDEIKTNIREMMLVITSVQFADEIIRQLDNLEACNNQEVYIPALFCGDENRIELENEENRIIPKVLHYCWFGKGSMPDRFQSNIESWKRMCPDYEIIRWDENNYDYKKSRYMKQAYEAEKWGFVPDYARLDIVNTYGGIYLDTDVELVKPLDDFLQFNLFCGFENNWFVNFGLGFGGTAENSILREMLDLYDKTEFEKQDGTWDLTASPVYQTKILAEHGLVRNGCSQKHDDFAVFSAEYFSPINVYGIGKVTANTYSIHQYAATWFGDKQKAVREKMLKSVKFVMERI